MNIKIIRLGNKIRVRINPNPPATCKLAEQNGNDIMLRAVYHQLTGI